MVKKHATDELSVKQVCAQVGIGAHTLRAWETRYAALVPSRSGSGQRRYNARHVQRLRSIVTLLNKGQAVSTVAALNDPSLSALEQKIRRAALAPVAAPAVLKKSFEKHLLDFHLARIAETLEEEHQALGSRSFILRVLAPLMQWVGKRVQRGELGIAHEHALSAIVRDQLHKTRGSARAKTPLARSFVLTTPEGDLHEFGILMAASLISHHGIPAHYLGPNLPAPSLAEATRGLRATTVLLGVTSMLEDREVPLGSFLAQLHSALPPETEIWIGGHGYLPHLDGLLRGRTYRVFDSLDELDAVVEREVNE